MNAFVVNYEEKLGLRVAEWNPDAYVYNINFSYLYLEIKTGLIFLNPKTMINA